MVANLGLRLDTDAQPSIFGDRYLRLTVSTCEIADDGTPRNIPTDPYAGDALRPFAGITISAQADDKYPENGRAYSYGWTLGISTLGTFDVMPGETVAIVGRTLAKVSRALAAADARYGRPATFGAYVARVADALGCPVLTGHAGDDGRYNTGSWVRWTSGDAVSIIDNRIAQHRTAD